MWSNKEEPHWGLAKFDELISKRRAEPDAQYSLCMVGKFKLFSSKLETGLRSYQATIDNARKACGISAL